MNPIFWISLGVLLTMAILFATLRIRQAMNEIKADIQRLSEPKDTDPKLSDNYMLNHEEKIRQKNKEDLMNRLRTICATRFEPKPEYIILDDEEYNLISGTPYLHSVNGEITATTRQKLSQMKLEERIGKLEEIQGGKRDS